VLAGLVLHPASKAWDLLRYWREFGPTAPEELTDGALLFTAAPEVPLPDVLRQGPILGLGGVFVGPLETGEQVLRPLREFALPAADMFQTMPYSAAQTMADFLWPRGTYNYWRSNFLKSLTDGAIDTILDFYSKAPSPRTVVVLEHNGHGAMERISEDATAFGHRNWPYNFLVTTIWTDAADSDTNIRWTREFFEAMQPFLAEAVYVNYLGEMEENGARAAYGRKYERLAALKDKYDATNFFCMNQNIKPSRAASRGAD